MTGTGRETLRTTFGQDAELYDQCRPAYPPALFTDLATLAGLGPRCRVLEIGCGTGQATLPLAQRGCEVVAIDLSPGMAAVARRNGGLRGLAAPGRNLRRDPLRDRIPLARPRRTHEQSR